MVSGDPLELSKEAPGEEQTRGVLQEPLPDLPGVRREPAETRAVRLSESGQSGDGAGETDDTAQMTSCWTGHIVKFVQDDSVIDFQSNKYLAANIHFTFNTFSGIHY